MDFVDFTQNSDVMEYMYKDEEELDWPEFFEIYKERFPLLVYITGGNYGETIYDDFCSDQIYRVQTYSNQRRIVAKATKVYDRYIDIYLSIPISTTHKFCVVRGHRSVQEAPKTLEEIVSENPFPIPVTFAPDVSEIYVGTSREDVSSYATILLTREYTENFLLGNCVMNGQVCKTVTVAAVSALISVAPASGIQGKSAEFFRKHLSKLQASLADVTYDRTVGNTSITKITSEGTGTGNILPKLNPPLLPVEHKPDTEKNESSDDSDDWYERPPEPTIKPPLPPRSEESPPTPIKKTTDAPLYPKKYYENAAIVHPIPSTSKTPAAPPRPQKKSVLPQTSTQKPATKLQSTGKSPVPGRGPLPDPTSSTVKENQLFSEADYMYMKEPDDMYEVLSNVPQPTTEIKSQTGEKKIPTVSSSGFGGNNIVPTVPTVASSGFGGNNIVPTVPTVSSSGFGGNNIVPTETKQEAASNQSDDKDKSTGGKQHLLALSVDDIGEYLRKMRLDKYVERFAEDMIDGVILGELTKENLKEDYGFRSVEQIKLWKFITDGYIPQ
ncbi:uncharacterized protein LOC110454879 [Mizuhopecten yessoensis]|uniref:SAM domain-containing protein n=1 Tax=Mizuhopecten yessoensis TaxID=6573 RepID=A0A210QE82_MIZYE|nr:uncharacterized protein LOC110454879 [Mizuhopecten yessoensis]OWF47033.1 hypothetical protein KP79_PYT01360 [Mizuhopecten yessoensis]